MDIAIGNRSQATGRFNFVRDPKTNDVAFDNTEAHAVMASALEDLGTYWADSTHGSELYKITNLDSKAPSQAEATVAAAELPLEQAGRIDNVSVKATPATSNGQRTGTLNVNLRWKGVNGSNEQNAEI